METHLEDNEVKEIARMQSLINGYEAFILAVSFMISGKDDVTYPLFTYTELEKPMKRIWDFVKESRNKQ